MRVNPASVAGVVPSKNCSTFMSSKSKAMLPRDPLSSRRIAFLRPVANRVASKVASAPPLNRPTKIAASSTVT
jgi:hypothetical protein